jgi:hypothetical protein
MGYRLELSGVEEFGLGSHIKLLFRPEDIVLSSSVLPNDVIHLSDGTVEETVFIGSYERLTVRIDLSDRSNERRVVVTVPKQHAAFNGISTGKRVAVGLSDYRILPGLTTT